MSIYFLAQLLTKTIQAPQTITAAAAGAVTVASTTGWANGDLALVSGVLGATGVNGLCRLTVTDATHFTLTSPSTGATLAFGGTYTSGGTVTHIGYQTPALTLDTTVFTTPNPPFLLRSEIFTLNAGLEIPAGVRVHISDTGDAFTADIKSGPTFNTYGYVSGPTAPVCEHRTRGDWPNARIGNANNALRLTVYLEGQYGAAPATGTTVTLSAWLEA